MPKNIRTQEAINAEVVALEAMKPSVRETSIFGDNHHDAIDAQVAVLKEVLSDNQIYARYGDEEEDDFSASVLEAALSVRNWLEGDDSDGTPSEGWQDLVQ